MIVLPVPDKIEGEALSTELYNAGFRYTGAAIFPRQVEDKPLVMVVGDELQILVDEGSSESAVRAIVTAHVPPPPPPPPAPLDVLLQRTGMSRKQLTEAIREAIREDPGGVIR